MATPLVIPVGDSRFMTTSTDGSFAISAANYLSMPMLPVGVGDLGTPCADYVAMANRWDLPMDLRGGTPRMREQRDKWLPREEAESVEKYNIRIDHSFLSDHYADSCTRLSDRPFGKAAQVLGDEVPDLYRQIETNIDGQGTTLTEQANLLLLDALHFGKSHLFVDFTRLSPSATLAQEQEVGARAVIRQISATDIIGWRSEVRGGVRQLTEVRWMERDVMVTPAEPYKDIIVERVRRITPTEWELWQKVRLTAGQQSIDRWIKIDGGPLTLGFIPLYTLYLAQTSFMVSRPTMESLAWCQLAHFQSSSEQRNLLRFARCGVIVGTGLTEEDIKKPIVIAPTTALMTTSEVAKYSYLEHTGAAMEIGSKDLECLEGRMDYLGFKPFVSGQSGTVSATSSVVTESRSHAAITKWVRAVELVYEQALKTASRWHKQDPPTKFKVDIFSDFYISTRTRDDVLALLEARAMGEIGRKTLIEELQRRSLLSDQRDPEDEIDMAEKDGPSVVKTGPGGFGMGVRDVTDPTRAGNDNPQTKPGQRGPDAADGHGRGLI